MIWQMVRSTLNARYAASRMGSFWVVLNPFLLAAAISFVFSRVLRAGFEQFPLFVLAGIVPWSFFSNAVSESSGSFLRSQGILRQFSVPRLFIPVSSVLAAFVAFCAGMAVTVLLTVVLHGPAVLVLLPLVMLTMLMLCAFSAGVGLLVSVANVFVRDVAEVLPMLLMLWFWMTPVFYTVEMVPQTLRWMIYANPLTPFILVFQDTIFYARLPRLLPLALSCAWTVAGLACGLAVFNRLQSKLLKAL